MNYADELRGLHQNGHKAAAAAEAPSRAEERLREALAEPWPEPMDAAARYGLVGEIVATVEPHTESDPAALLLQVLTAFGNVIGRTAHFRAESDRHYGNLFACLVGSTSKGRKGTSAGRTRGLFLEVDEQWSSNCIAGGLSSGEGLISAVRDPITKTEPIREAGGKNKGKGKIIDYEQVQTDAGVTDKRLYIEESEFVSVLRVAARDKNTITAIIRQAWDTGNLRTLTKNSPVRATGAHISIVGHITREELRQSIATVDLANGLANRFLWACVRRSRVLPDGGQLQDQALRTLVHELQAAVEDARQVGEMGRDEAARKLWHAVYPELSGGKPGLLGAATSRAEAQVMRLAMLYALLDLESAISAVHLEAALAVWDYCERSARYIFGNALGNPTADAILRLLRGSPGGATRSEIRELFSGNNGKSEIEGALALLLEHDLVRAESDRGEGVGRPAERWFAKS